jgi:hypothetical protein
MSDAVTRLLSDAAFSFVGTVEHVGAATMEDVAVDEATLVVHVDQVLHAPESFGTLAGELVTLQPADGAPAAEEGSQWAFFANGLAFGASIALTEVGRLAVDDVEKAGPQTTAANAEPPFEALQAEIEATRVRGHADDADAVVLGRVVGLERASGSPLGEHHPDWWRATLHVVHVERGDIKADSEVKVLYANSLDVRWRDAPKPKASQNGLWLLHATQGDEHELAPFQILHAADFQPSQNLEALREGNTP